MRGETTCPECSGPVDDHGYTTADPARLARLEGLLREIEEALGRSIKRADRNASQTIRFARLESADLQRRIAKALGPAATEEGG